MDYSEVTQRLDALRWLALGPLRGSTLHIRYRDLRRAVANSKQVGGPDGLDIHERALTRQVELLERDINAANVLLSTWAQKGSGR